MKGKVGKILIGLIIVILIIFSSTGYRNYKRLSSRIEDKYVIHLKRNSKLLNYAIKKNGNLENNEIELDAFLESLNSIEMIMDLLTRETMQSDKEYKVIDSMWALNSSVMTPLVFNDKKDIESSSRKVDIDDLLEIEKFYQEFSVESSMDWDLVIENWQEILDEYIEKYPNNIYFKYYINKYNI